MTGRAVLAAPVWAGPVADSIQPSGDVAQAEAPAGEAAPAPEPSAHSGGSDPHAQNTSSYHLRVPREHGAARDHLSSFPSGELTPEPCVTPDPAWQIDGKHSIAAVLAARVARLADGPDPVMPTVSAQQQSNWAKPSPHEPARPARRYSAVCVASALCVLLLVLGGGAAACVLLLLPRIRGGAGAADGWAGATDHSARGDEFNVTFPLGADPLVLTASHEPWCRAAGVGGHLSRGGVRDRRSIRAFGFHGGPWADMCARGFAWHTSGQRDVCVGFGHSHAESISAGAHVTLDVQALAGSSAHVLGGWAKCFRPNREAICSSMWTLNDPVTDTTQLLVYCAHGASVNLVCGGRAAKDERGADSSRGHDTHTAGSAAPDDCASAGYAPPAADDHSAAALLPPGQLGELYLYDHGSASAVSFGLPSPPSPAVNSAGGGGHHGDASAYDRRHDRHGRLKRQPDSVGEALVMLLMRDDVV